MNVAIVGAGYAGLAAGVGFAMCGNSVFLVDVDEDKVEMINQSKAPIHEEGLDTLLPSLSHRIKATTNTNVAVERAEIIFLCVQTSCGKNGSIDLTHIKQAATNVGKALQSSRITYPIVSTKSTVVPGTTEKIIKPILEEESGKKAGVDFGITVNPEFLRMGKSIEDFLHPDRTVIGEMETIDGDILCELYKDISGPIIRVDCKTAEMAKYASNIFLATKISLVNEIGNICKRLGIDVYEVAQVMGFDKRITRHFLDAGIGYGGSCLPKDIDAIISAAREIGYQPSLLQCVSALNKDQPLRLVEMAQSKVGDLSGKKVAVLGLSFKPGTDDIRHSPSFSIVGELIKRGAIIKAYDPAAMERTKAIFDHEIDYTASAREAVEECDLVFVATGWSEFCDPALYEGKTVFDGRRVVNPSQLKNCDYEGVCW